MLTVDPKLRINIRQIRKVCDVCVCVCVCVCVLILMKFTYTHTIFFSAPASAFWVS